MSKKDQKVTEVTGKNYCTAEGCKSNEWKFSFCGEHYEQFKFGLITKQGKKVSDYEKKIDHYMSYKKDIGQKAA
jgi:hypothetical protein